MPEETTTRRSTLVQPVSINFNSEAWRVSEGAGTFVARVEDDEFLRLLDTGTEPIRKTTPSMLIFVPSSITTRTDASGVAMRSSGSTPRTR